MYTYLTNVYSKNARPFTYNIKLEETGADVVFILAQLHKDGRRMDVRRGAYVIELLSMVEISRQNLNNILTSLNNYDVENFKQIFPTKYDVSNVTETQMSLEEAFEQFGAILYSHYPSNYIYNSAYPISCVRMLNNKKISIDPDQEVIMFSKLRNHSPNIEYNLISFGKYENYLARNTLMHMKGEPIVFVVDDDYVALSANCGYIQYNNTLVWLISKHILVSNINDRTSSFDAEILHSNVQNALPDFKNMLLYYNVLSTITTDDESIYTYDNNTEVLYFVGNFPCQQTDPAIERIYIETIKLYTNDILPAHQPITNM